MTSTSNTTKYLENKIAPPHSHIVAPNLGFFKTHFEIEPLIKKVEQSAIKAFDHYPSTPVRIIATSLGGVLWVEVLSRHPEWWSKIESLVLLGSPIGGAALARIIDPFDWGIGMAKHLGENRRPLAEKITAVVPTLVVAGNLDYDGPVTTESIKLKHAHFVCVNGVLHQFLGSNPDVAKAIQEFWSKPRQPLPAPKVTLASELIEHFRAVNGITDANTRDFRYAKVVFTFADGTDLRAWRNPLGVKHLFIANAYGKCEYGGFVGWVHTDGLNSAIDNAIVLFRDFRSKSS
jgi:hypothetical protein